VIAPRKLRAPALAGATELADVLATMALLVGGGGGCGDGAPGLSFPHPTAAARAKTMTSWVFLLTPPTRQCEKQPRVGSTTRAEGWDEANYGMADSEASLTMFDGSVSGSVLPTGR
jgi:hypothetical protein